MALTNPWIFEPVVALRLKRLANQLHGGQLLDPGLGTDALAGLV